MKYRCCICVALLCSLAGSAWAEEEKDPRPAKGLQDNSFLIEEAYNQEAGVVQHITTLRRQGRDWFFNFIQEWPIGNQTHQFSYSIPYSWLRTSGRTVQGVGDILLNYRWQAMLETDRTPAVAPRFSLIVPTGSAANDLGNGSFGYQFNLPVSKIVSDRVTLHGNAGLTSYFHVQGRQPTSFFLGGSAVYAVTRDFNVLVEALGEWNASVNSFGGIERERSFTLSPGIRQAFNFPGGTQVVAGFGAPIRFVEGGGVAYGAIGYFSVEHSFLK